MDLMHNPIGNMYGPTFLVVYAGVIVSVFILTKILFYLLDSSNSLDIPKVPSIVDPYEIAYLRGGENEVTRLAILDLIQRGYLERITKVKGEDQIVQAPGHPDERHLNPLEKKVFSCFITPLIGHEIFQSQLARQVGTHCVDYQRKLEQEKFMLTESTRGLFNKVMSIGLLIIGGLGIYKLVVAIATNHYNVSFLVLMGIGAAFAYVYFCNPPRMSARGRKYLERLQLAYERLDQRESKLNFYTTDPALLLMAGIFGVGSLTGTVYSFYPTMFQKANNRWYSSSSCGAGCGYVASSCGSGGSCSSGGCGGGGCGGCGGG